MQLEGLYDKPVSRGRVELGEELEGLTGSHVDSSGMIDTK